jgi:2,4-dienoyl-CoA reductase-like NADH-dependent reductase (Old Yellow Enzyme family)
VVVFATQGESRCGVSFGVCALIENDVKALHQVELLKAAREVVADEFSITTRTSADESMTANDVDVMDVISVLRTCDKVTMNFAKWPCVEYHGVTQDGYRLVVVAVIHQPERTVKVVKVWKT